MKTILKKTVLLALTLPMMAQAQSTRLDDLRTFDHKRDVSYYRQRCIVSNRNSYQQQLFLNNTLNSKEIRRAGITVSGQIPLDQLGFSANTIQFTGDLTEDTRLLNEHKKMLNEQKLAYQDVMGNTSHRMWHLFWHAARNAWHVYTEQQKNFFRALSPSWEVTNMMAAPAGADSNAPEYNPTLNGAGEDFLSMHREMIKTTDTELINKGLPCVSSWEDVPEPTDRVWGFESLNILNIRQVTNDLGQPIRSEFVQKQPQEDRVTQDIRRYKAQFRDVSWLNNFYVGQGNHEGRTLSDVGFQVENTIHNYMHMQWANQKDYRRPENGGFSAAFRPGNTPLQVFTDSYEWTNNSYDYLGDSFAAHVNPLFWKLHGWVDDTITAWARAHGWADVYEPADCRVNETDGLAYEVATNKPVTDIFGGQLDYCVTFESKWLGDAPSHGVPAPTPVASERIIVTPSPAEIETVQIPAVFETITTRVKVDPNCIDSAELPCEFKTTTVRVIKEPARTVERVVPATTTTVTKRVTNGGHHGHHGHHGPSVLEKAKNLATSNPEAVRSILNNKPLPAIIERALPAAMVPAPPKAICKPTIDKHGNTIPCVQEVVTETVVVSEPAQSHGHHHGHHGHHGQGQDPETKKLTAEETKQWNNFVEEETSKVENFRNMDLAIETSSNFTDNSIYLETLNKSLAKIKDLQEEIRITGGTNSLKIELVKLQSYIPALQDRVKADRDKKRQGLLDAVRRDIKKKIK